MAIALGVLRLSEVAFIVVAPIYLYGWVKGLLIFSALSSLLELARVVRKIAGEF